MYPELSELQMADGFKANTVFFKLSFLDKTSIALGRQFKELFAHPVDEGRCYWQVPGSGE